MEQLISISDTPKTELSLDDIILRLHHSYAARGWAHQVWLNDSSLLRRIGHPDTATLRDMEAAILRAKSQGSRANYTARIKSLWRHMRRLGLTTSTTDEQLPDIRKPRSVPRPLTDAQVDHLLQHADQPYRDWFTLACYAGLRAMEIAKLKGVDLEEAPDGWSLRVQGKGGTDLLVPAAPQVVKVIQAHGRLGRLWELRANRVSTYACAEMRRLGVNRRLHDCRHWYATTLLEVTDGDLPTVAELMRHGSILTTRGYTALNPVRQRTAVSTLPDFTSRGGALPLVPLERVGV